MQNKDERIAELEDLLKMEAAIKNSEIMMNADLKEYNKKLEISLEEVSKINERFLKKIIKLQSIINQL
tara:strand:+ start:454 stop:657 length:204 start_codon:yes stop_codon:yes gene_type:complete